MADFDKQMALAMALKSAPQQMQPMGAADYPDVAPPQMMGAENAQQTQDLASIDAATEALRKSGLYQSDPNYMARLQQLYATRDKLRAPEMELNPTMPDQMMAGR